VPDTSPLDLLAEQLADILRERYRTSLPHDRLVSLMRDHRDAVATARRVTPDVALSLIDADTLDGLATGYADYLSKLGALDDLNMDAPINTVQLGHYEPAADELPALHMTPVGLLAEPMLIDLVAASAISVAIEAPHPHCEPEHRAPAPHQHLRLHMNAGPEYGHDNCLVASTCVGCDSRMLDALFTHREGWLRRYIPFGHRWVGQSRFTLVNPADGHALLESARARLTT